MSEDSLSGVMHKLFCQYQVNDIFVSFDQEQFSLSMRRHMGALQDWEAYPRGVQEKIVMMMMIIIIIIIVMKYI